MASTNSLISNISNQSIRLFFENKITSFKPEKDVFTNVVNEERPYSDPIKIGNAELKNHEELLVFTCEYNKELTARSAKKEQFEIAKKVLKEDFKDGAIFIFYDTQGNFRFSFIRRNYGDKSAKYSNWKRYTYYVEPDKQNKTFKNRIENCHFDSLDNIQEAFSVEPLSTEFYKDLSYWYFWSLKEIQFPNDQNENEEVLKANAMIRLITRVIFVWFMKQKKLVPNELFDKSSLENLLNYDDSTGSTYYKAILQNLFFATLSTPKEKNRKFVTSQYGVQNFFRYKRFIKDEDTFLKLMDRIPFLNGGLFENLDIVKPEENIDIRIDCFSENKKNEERLVVPDYLFFGEHTADVSQQLNNDKLNNVQVLGLIDLLNRYDFTIDENTPYDQEVALDPELLGLVFENLLASYNPESKDTARKESGSFYTPREIVDYMVEESLVQNIISKTNLDEDKLRLLFTTDKVQPFDSLKDKKAIIQRISQIKILDPACGSGAFPMGALQKMTHILSKLDEDNSIWFDTQKQIAIEETIEAYENKDDTERKSRIAAIEEAFAKGQNEPDYARKLFLIENCLYGVDIQPIAMQISKLRFFISLLVEQKINPEKENFGIIALPNLETKFVAANTLKGLPGKMKSGQSYTLKNPKVEELEKKLEKVRDEHFNARTPKTKKKKRALDNEIRQKIADLLISDGFPNETAQAILKWNPYDANTSSSWFDPEWMFGLQSFDIVIGNPPYIDSERMVNLGMTDLRDELKELYKSLRGNWDIYIAFFDFGFSVLNKNGVLTYITPDKWLNKSFGKELRKNHYKKLTKIARTGRDVFQSVGVDSIITIFKNIQSTTFTVVDYDGSFNDKTIIEKSILEDPFQLDIIFSSYLDMIMSISNKFKNTIDSLGFVCENACSTSETYELKKYLKNDSFDSSKYKVVNTGTIGKFKSKWGDKEMTYLKDKYLKPVVDRNIFQKNMSNTYFKKTNLSKLIIKGMTLLDVMYDEEGNYIPGKSTLIIHNVNKIEHKGYLSLMCLLNSKFTLFYLQERYSASSYNGGITFNKDMFNKLPIPSDISALENISINIYKKINASQDIEQEIELVDLIVSKLYRLTYREVRIIDPEFSLTQEEYENYNIDS